MEAIIGFGGIILGFVLSEIATWFRQLRTDGEQASSVRALIRIEIDHNLSQVRSFREAVAQEADQLPHDLQGQRAALRSVTLPQLIHSIWDSQISLVTKALSEKEIKQVLNVYHGLDRLTVIRLELSEPSGNMFHDNKLYNEFIEISNDLLEKGNPITRKRSGMR